MPILDVGYRTWEGVRTPRWSRAFIVATTGIHLVWKGAWLKRVLLFMAAPALLAAIFVGGFEQTVDRAGAQDAVRWMLSAPPARAVATRSGLDVESAIADPASARHFAWTFVLFNLFRYPQSLGMILVVGLVAPRLISYDLRSRGYLLYLSRPLTPWEYVFGKAGIVFFLLLMMTAVPALLIYLVGLFLSTDVWAIAQTWDLPLRIVFASMVLILPTTAVALALSSLTQESRYAGFAWFAFWVIGAVSFRVIWFSEQARNRRGPPRFDEFDQYSSWMLLSPYETLGYLQQQIFGLNQTDTFNWAPWVAVVAVSIIGFSITHWRVARMLKA
ncbi:MAG: ABC transporter permease subunit [Planctomycetota bacterium]